MSEGLRKLESINFWFKINDYFDASDVLKFTLKNNFRMVEEELKDYEECKQILDDYGLSLPDFRHACFTFAQFKGSKGFEGVEKKLKALEIIKEILTINEDDFYEENGKYYFIGNEVDKDTFGLLKEVLL